MLRGFGAVFEPVGLHMAARMKFIVGGAMIVAVNVADDAVADARTFIRDRFGIDIPAAASDQ